MEFFLNIPLLFLFILSIFLTLYFFYKHRPEKYNSKIGMFVHKIDYNFDFFGQLLRVERLYQNENIALVSLYNCFGSPLKHNRIALEIPHGSVLEEGKIYDIETQSRLHMKNTFSLQITHVYRPSEGMCI